MILRLLIVNLEIVHFINHWPDLVIYPKCIFDLHTGLDYKLGMLLHGEMFTCKATNHSTLSHTPQLHHIWLHDMRPNSSLAISHDNNLYKSQSDSSCTLQYNNTSSSNCFSSWKYLNGACKENARRMTGNSAWFPFRTLSTVVALVPKVPLQTPQDSLPCELSATVIC